ncbi:hypothetical protein PWY87_20885 [Kribbella solani]|uniref:hypothetical protein n=1 Tax=Kribbella solani TaxID=236067 RepID=UPI0029BF0FC9|nr:hypothetical protein [Kribbella solani]MDX3004158.1 hypothetical protein [Kribbella solani]
MRENAIGRRQALTGAGIAAGGVAVAGLAATPAMADDGNRLQGSWMCLRQDAGTTAKIRLVVSFCGGDVFISQDISPSGTPFTGTWSAHDERFQATFWTGSPGTQGPASVGPAIRVQLRGSVSRGKLTGTYRVTVYAPGSVTQVIDSTTGTVSGRRIAA